ncbi:MAG: FMN-binding protein [Rikenellaceae bacterium]|nr:FMN-binding protein [Rikenellaceae bacterium]
MKKTKKLTCVIAIMTLVTFTAGTIEDVLGNSLADSQDEGSTMKPVMSQLGFEDTVYKNTADGVWRLDNGVAVYSSSRYAGDVKGFRGEVPLFIAVDQNNIIVGIAAGENRETPDYWNFVVNSGLLQKWNGMTLDAALHSEADVVSGATSSSTGVINTVRKTISGIKDNLK